MKNLYQVLFTAVVAASFAASIANARSQTESSSSPGFLDQILSDPEPMQDVTTEQAAVLLLSRARVPGGIVEVRPCKLSAASSTPKHSYSFAGSTLRRALEAIVADDPRYKWELRNNVVNFTPVNGLPELLRLKLRHFEVLHDDTLEGVGARLFDSPQVKEVAARRGMMKENRTLFLFGGAPPRLNSKQAFDDATVIDILNTVLLSNKNPAVWHYSELAGECKNTYYLEWPLR